jgi:rRNA maturation protein Nop10
MPPLIKNNGYTATEACYVCGGGNEIGSTPPTPPSTRQEQCEDIPGWYHSEGPTYDCTWYAEYDACQSDGSFFDNDRYTVSDACCVCGGGNKIGSTPPP